MVNAEYKNKGVSYPTYFNRIKGKKVLIIADDNTKKFIGVIEPELKKYAKNIKTLVLSPNGSKDLIPDETAYERVIKEAESFDNILAVGSGTLNDIAKYAAFNLKITNSVLATAPSMDGYVSTVAALMRNSKKVTLDAQSPSDVLIDTDILATAPSIMVAAGVGDILGKYNSLLDWRMSHLKNGEPINEEAVSVTLDAVVAVRNNLDKILKYDKEGLKYLMDALVVSGTAINIAGSSRPASGAEHHTSHYLEMWFADHGLPIPLHGIKVGLGTMVCITLYRELKKENYKFNNSDEVYKYVDDLPDEEEIKEIFRKLNAPTRYRDIGVSKELMREMLLNCYKVRERYTVLRMCVENGIMERFVPMLIEKYW